MWFKVAFLLILGGTGSSALVDIIARLLVSTDVGTLKFYYVPSAGQKVEIKYGNLASLQASGIVAGIDTTLVIDGFLSSADTPMASTIRNSLVSQPIQRNILVLDWSSMSGGVAGLTSLNTALGLALYPLVLLNVVPVGVRVAAFLEWIRLNANIDQSQVHIVAHSLGAHAAGRAGYTSKTTYGKTIKRISGLDPAGPVYYLSLNPADMITSGDASFVDLYHTSRGLMGDSRTGTGNIDVYVNGGTIQPGCPVVSTGVPGYCAHTYSWQLYNATIYRNDFYACPCSASAPLLSPTCFCDPASATCGDVPTCSGGIPIMDKATPAIFGEFHSTISEIFA